jgi:hypothetical protein
MATGRKSTRSTEHCQCNADCAACWYGPYNNCWCARPANPETGLCTPCERERPLGYGPTRYSGDAAYDWRRPVSDVVR